MIIDTLITLFWIHDTLVFSQLCIIAHNRGEDGSRFLIRTTVDNGDNYYLLNKIERQFTKKQSKRKFFQQKTSPHIATNNQKNSLLLTVPVHDISKMRFLRLIM